jgi:hypothetical protein
MSRADRRPGEMRESGQERRNASGGENPFASGGRPDVAGISTLPLRVFSTVRPCAVGGPRYRSMPPGRLATELDC